MKKRNVRGVVAILTIIIIATGMYLSRGSKQIAINVIQPSYLVSISQNIEYAQGKSYQKTSYERLLTDIYQPSGDSRTTRPAIILVHGGGFYSGDKNIYGGEYGDPEAQFGWGDYFASRGYVVFAPNYRLANIQVKPDDPRAREIINMTVSDVLSLVRYIRQNTTKYRVDPERIIVGGHSAGAIIALYATYYPNRTLNSSNPGSSDTVAAVFALAGGMLDTDLGLINSKSVPALMFHGTEDKMVPYSWAANVVDKLKSSGVRVDFYSFPNQGHEVAGYAEGAETILNFLNENLKPKAIINPSVEAKPSNIVPIVSVKPSVLPTLSPNASPSVSIPSPNPSIVLSPSPTLKKNTVNKVIKPSSLPAKASVSVGNPLPSATPSFYEPFVWQGKPEGMVVQQSNVVVEEEENLFQKLWAWILGFFGK